MYPDNIQLDKFNSVESFQDSVRKLPKPTSEPPSPSVSRSSSPPPMNDSETADDDDIEDEHDSEEEREELSQREPSTGRQTPVLA